MATKYTREDIFKALHNCETTNRIAIMNISDSQLCLYIAGEYHNLKEAKADARQMQRTARESYDKKAEFVAVDRIERRIYKIK